MKLTTKMALVIATILVCILGVFASTGSDASPDGLSFAARTNTGINFSLTLGLDTVNGTDAIANQDNVTFWTDIDGTWKINGTNSTELGNMTLNWSIPNLAVEWEGTVLWNALLSNKTNGKSWIFSTNRSFTLDMIRMYSLTIDDANNTLYNTFPPKINLTVVSTDEPLHCCVFVDGFSQECSSIVMNSTTKEFGGSASTHQWDESLIATPKYHTAFFNCTKSGALTESGAKIENVSDQWTFRYQSAISNITANRFSGEWLNTGAVNITLTAIDPFNYTVCDVYEDFSGTWGKNQSVTLRNNTGSGMTLFNVADSIDGYNWGYRCNNSGNQMSIVNFTLYVDTVAPDLVSCVSPANLTRATDRLPTFVWTGVYDLGFANYTLRLKYQNQSIFDEYVITSNSTVSYEITRNLTADTHFLWNLTTTDNAGNKNTSSDCYGGLDYFADSNGYQLYRGYNFYSIVRNTSAVKVSASKLCGEMSVTPTSVSTWNSTHTWATHVCGTASGNFTLDRGEVVVINMPSDGYWNSGRVWSLNTTINYWNITNGTIGGAWNLVGVPLDTNLSLVNAGLKHHSNTGEAVGNYSARIDTVNWVVYPNHTGTYIPYKSGLNWTFNLNQGALQEGDALWVHLNASQQTTMFLNRIYWNTTTFTA